MSPIEIWAAITGLLCVYLTTKEKISSYPVGFVNLGLFVVMFYQAKLYADMMLQVFFFFLMVYGLFIWLSGNKNAKQVRVTRDMTPTEFKYSMLGFVFLSLGWAFILHKYTDAAIPWIDAPIAVASILAQYFLSKKVLQNWIIWIVIDVFSVGMYAYKQLYLTSGLYAIFLILAVKGYYDWKKEESYARLSNR